MKIYTKTGDNGTTSLIGGSRVPKYHIRIEAYGTVDELNSYMGLIRDMPDIDSKSIQTIIQIQQKLMNISAILASEQHNSMSIPKINQSDIEFVEKEIDNISENLPVMKAFVLPGGNCTASHVHVARCICRRAERTVLMLYSKYDSNELLIKYLNRLSDYLFILARKISNSLGIKETYWNPK